MRRESDTRTDRPLVDGQDRIDRLTDIELEAEVTIAAAQPHRRADRLDALLHELARRRHPLGTPRLGSP
jgi:hypothetical protein